MRRFLFPLMLFFSLLLPIQPRLFSQINNDTILLHTLEGSLDVSSYCGFCPSRDNIAFIWIWRDVLYAQLFDYEFQPLSDPVRLGLSDYGAEIDVLDDGSYIIVRKFYESDSYKGLAVCKLLQNGKVVNFFSQQTQAAQMQQALYIIDGQSVLISWSANPRPQQNDWDANDIYAVILNADGTTKKSLFTLNSNNEGYNCQGQFLRLHNGDFVYTWNRIRSEGGKIYIYFQRYSSKFDRLGEPYLLYTNYGIQFWQRISNTHAISYDDRFMISWEIRFEFDSYYDVFAQFFSNQGEPLGDKKQINTFQTNAQKDHTVCKIGDDKAVFAWYNHLYKEKWHSIFAQVIDYNGTRLGDEQKLIIPAHGQEDPNNVSLSSSRALIWWYVTGKIYSKVFDENIGWIGGRWDVLENNIRTGVSWYSLQIKRTNDKLIGCWFTGNDSNTFLYALALPSTDTKRALSPFRIISPINDVTLNEPHVKIVWQNPTREKLIYPTEIFSTIYLAQNPNFSSPEQFHAFTDTTMTLSNLQQGTTYFVKVLGHNAYGDSLWSSNSVGFFVSRTAEVYAPKAVPLELELYANYPNPFNPKTDIRVDTPIDGIVELNLYNARGALINTLLHTFKSAGPCTVQWDSRDAHGNTVATGVYLYQLKLNALDGTLLQKIGKMSFVR